jgi:membrane protease YdiL (CAAX protease family)
VSVPQTHPGPYLPYQPPDPRPTLDRAVATLAADPAPARWGLAGGRAVGGLVALLVLLGLTAGLARPGQDGAAAASLVAELLLGLVVYLAARPVVLRHGGWRRTLGLAAPDARDAAIGFGWFLLQVVARAAAAIVLVLVLPHFTVRSASNTTGLTHAHLAALVLVGLAAVGVAPVVEETMFRGLLLRGLMRRWGFWPGALLSSFLFGLFHSYQASSGWGALTLGLLMSLFGLLQCLLVRLTGRLAPTMITHGLGNLLAVVVAAGV